MTNEIKEIIISEILGESRTKAKRLYYKFKKEVTRREFKDLVYETLLVKNPFTNMIPTVKPRTHVGNKKIRIRTSRKSVNDKFKRRNGITGLTTNWKENTPFVKPIFIRSIDGKEVTCTTQENRHLNFLAKRELLIQAAKDRLLEPFRKNEVKINPNNIYKTELKRVKRTWTVGSGSKLDPNRFKVVTQEVWTKVIIRSDIEIAGKFTTKPFGLDVVTDPVSGRTTFKAFENTITQKPNVNKQSEKEIKAIQHSTTLMKKALRETQLENIRRKKVKSPIKRRHLNNNRPSHYKGDTIYEKKVPRELTKEEQEHLKARHDRLVQRIEHRQPKKELNLSRKELIKTTYDKKQENLQNYTQQHDSKEKKERKDKRINRGLKKLSKIVSRMEDKEHKKKYLETT